MRRHPYPLVLVLVLAIVQSLGQAHCTWTSAEAACAMTVFPDTPSRPPAGGSPAAAARHGCCERGDSAGPAGTAEAPAPPDRSAEPDGCDCPCMRQPMAAPAPSALATTGSPLRECPAVLALPDAVDAPAPCAGAILPASEGPPGSEPPLDSATPRGPPTLA